MKPVSIKFKRVLKDIIDDKETSLTLNHTKWFVAIAATYVENKKKEAACILINASGLTTISQALRMNGYNAATVRPLSKEDVPRIKEQGFDSTLYLHPDYSDGTAMGWNTLHTLRPSLIEHLCDELKKRPERPLNDKNSGRLDLSLHHKYLG